MPNSISEEMNSLPKTNTYEVFSSPTASIMSEMTSNTVGYKHKAGVGSKNMVDSNKVVVAKKDILTFNHSATSVASTIEKENSMSGRSRKSTKLGRILYRYS